MYRICLNIVIVYYEICRCYFQKCGIIIHKNNKEIHVQVVHMDFKKWNFCIIFKTIITIMELRSLYYIKPHIGIHNRTMELKKIKAYRSCHEQNLKSMVDKDNS